MDMLGARRIPDTALDTGVSTLEPAVELDRLTLRFRDRLVEAAYRLDTYHHNIANIRIAHLIGIGLWVSWGFWLRGYLLRSDQVVDLVVRYAVLIPILVVGLALSFTPAYRRTWEWVLAGELLATMGAWIYYVAELRTMPPDFGYVGIILITAFTYTLIRVRFVVQALLTTVAITLYLPYAIITPGIFGVRTHLAAFYLTTFGGLGILAAYRIERFTRLLFLRERQLEREHQRSDGLLLNILPQNIVDRLKARNGTGRLAEAFDDVSIIFADAVGSTEQGAKTSPDALVDALDGLFRKFDELADRYGLEKIKTVGDAYMAAAGAPVPRKDHATAAADMALAILEEGHDLRWPSGDPIVMRIGVASGPAVAGVIGQRKFAYDLWGDTVNLASRLESYGEPGRILVSEAVAERLSDQYEFGPRQIVDLKGKGPTPVRFLLGRTAAATPGRQRVQG